MVIKLFGAGIDETREVERDCSEYHCYKLDTDKIMDDANKGVLRHPDELIPMITLRFKKTNFKTHIPLYVCEGDGDKS
jgi:hypothetical protein